MQYDHPELVINQTALAAGDSGGSVLLQEILDLSQMFLLAAIIVIAFLCVCTSIVVMVRNDSRIDCLSASEKGFHGQYDNDEAWPIYMSDVVCG